MKKQAGFTLVELVIVVVILGLLAVTAIPKFLDLTDQAKRASVEGVAGGFATAVSLVRSQWEAEARPKDGSGNNVVNYDGVQMFLTAENTATGIRPGYVTGSENGQGSAGSGLGGGFTAANCVDIWNSIFQQPARITSSSDSDDLADSDYFTNSASITTNGNANPACYYYQVVSLDQTNGVYDAPAAGEDVGNYFTYEPANSNVAITINIQ